MGWKSLLPWRAGGSEGLNRGGPTCSLYQGLPAKSSQLSLSQKSKLLTIQPRHMCSSCLPSLNALGSCTTRFA